MTVQRIDKSSTVATTSKTRRVRGSGGEDFSWHLSAVSEMEGPEEVESVGTATDGGSRRQRQDQLEQTQELLDSLEALVGDNWQEENVRQRLRDSRDQALRTLSESPRPGEERDLLQRTTLLATVELAKSERGDYT